MIIEQLKNMSIEQLNEMNKCNWSDEKRYCTECGVELGTNEYEVCTTCDNKNLIKGVDF